MKRTVITGALASLAVGALVGGGTFALFSDNEVSGSQSISAGTLDLVDGGTASTAPLAMTNVKPGDAIDSKTVTLHNAGSLPGSGNYEIVVTGDAENGCNEAENPGEVADRATCNGDTDGELDDNLKVSVNGALAVSLSDLDGVDFALSLAGDDGAAGGPDEVTVTLEFSLDGLVGNVVQSDSVAFEVRADIAQL